MIHPRIQVWTSQAWSGVVGCPLTIVQLQVITFGIGALHSLVPETPQSRQAALSVLWCSGKKTIYLVLCALVQLGTEAQ